MSDFLTALHTIDNESKAWRNAPHVGAPPRSWWVAIESFLVAACATRPDPQFAKPVADLVDAYLNAMTKAANGEMEFDPDLANEEAVKVLEIALAPIGRALAALGIAEKNGPLDEPFPESIEELAKYKGESGVEIGNEQIARMWGIKTHEVALYLKGQWKLPKNHVPPGILDWRTERKREQAAWDAASYRWNFNSGGLLLSEDAPAPVDDWQEPAESIEQLLAEGVSVEQICRMWRVTPAEVNAVKTGHMSEEEELERLTAPEKGGR